MSCHLFEKTHHVVRLKEMQTISRLFNWIPNSNITILTAHAIFISKLFFN